VEGRFTAALFHSLLDAIGLSVRLTAHEMRPAYLELCETQPGRFAVLWKTPMITRPD